MSAFLTGVRLCGMADHKVGGSRVTKSAHVGRASDRIYIRQLVFSLFPQLCLLHEILKLPL